ncbi:unnamed protein product, partial [marine sediment metagenome]
MYKLLYLVRGEPDFERVVALAIAGKDKFKQTFIFVGDGHPLFASAITNQFRKSLFAEHGFQIKDFCDYDPTGVILKKLSLKRDIPLDRREIGPILWSNKRLFIPIMFLVMLKIYLMIRAPRIARKVLKKISPDALLTDQSGSLEHYAPGVFPEVFSEVFRKVAFQMGMPSCIFTHGAAGGLHRAFTDPKYDPYRNYYVFACSD